MSLKKRTAIPKATQEKVLKEYDHKCAICGEARPHLHHIDEDPSNNSEHNLLPLCPNCHLTDQHNPTGHHETGILRLFRRHKTLVILTPQFHPLYARTKFMDEAPGSSWTRKEVADRIDDLVTFVRALEHGEYYAKAINKLISPPTFAGAFNLDEPDSETQRRTDERRAGTINKVSENRQRVEELVMELLRYQPWVYQKSPQ